jgi:hypothetical protein
LDRHRTTAGRTATLAERYRFISTDDAAGMQAFIATALQRDVSVETLALE